MNIACPDSSGQPSIKLNMPECCNELNLNHHHTHEGTNARFDSMQAAVIPGKWPGFDEEVQKRGEIGARYSELMKDRAVALVT